MNYAMLQKIMALLSLACVDQGGRQDFHFGGALFNDDVTMTSLVADIEPEILGGL